MKKNLITLFLAFTALVVAAQSGRVTYSETIKLNIKLEGEQSEQFANLLPKENVSQKMLTFTPEAALFEAVAKEDDAPQEMAEGGVFVSFKQSDDKVFFDIKEQKRIEQRDFMGRLFLIESQADTLQWKMTGNNKTIAGYNCMEATTELKENKIVAWFAPEIPVSTGPGTLHGLPGLILGVDVNQGERVTLATKVELAEVDGASLARPRKGKKVTRAEYEKIVDEKNKEMGIEPGKSGSGTVRMKIITR